MSFLLELRGAASPDGCTRTDADNHEAE